MRWQGNGGKWMEREWRRVGREEMGEGESGAGWVEAVGYEDGKRRMFR